jgi:hypothetical protein
MGRVLLIVLVGAVVALGAGPACAQSDKLQHFGLGYASASLGMSLSTDGDAASRRSYGILTALAVGAAKEAADPTFSTADLTADLLGGLAAVSLGGTTRSSSLSALSFTTVCVEDKTVFAAVYTFRF